ncbi:glutamate-rich protein 6B-like [Engraulis encrasicolus]|uniref:glutamate-rich protein 6B-like n=1 Tax=Engraulis encrasicolus TaxID=184585 RepID=UPI002FCF55F1
MSEKSEGKDAEEPGTTQRSSGTSPLELTVQNVQRLQRELEGLDKLYGSSLSIAGYIKDTENHLPIAHGSRKGPWEEQRISSRNSSRSSSSEHVDILGQDGIVIITRLSRSTQTDWDWVSRKLNHQTSCRPGCSQAEGSVPKHEKTPSPQHVEHKEPNAEESVGLQISRNNEDSQTDSKDPPKAEQLTEKFDKITTQRSSSDSSSKLQLTEVPNANASLCEYCQQVKKPEVTREKQAEKQSQAAEPETFFCCEIAWRMRTLFLRVEEEEEEEEKEEDKSTKFQHEFKINEEMQPVGESENQERAKQMLTNPERMRRLAETPPSGIRISPRPKPKIATKDTTIRYRLSEGLCNSQQESQLPEMEIITPPETLTLPESQAEVKRKNILLRHHRNGKTFVLIFPDGTGHVFYPSGRIAVLISSVHRGQFIYVILEDADLLPRVQAIFTSRGQATCYYPNGNVCVSMTPVGGTWCSESGSLKRRWSWFDLSAHVHAPPFQPISMSLSGNISIRIATQQDIRLTFTAGKNSVHFNMGTKLKMESEKGLMLPGPDILECFLKKKTVEMLCLLQKLQASVSFQRTEVEQIRSHYSLVAQSKRQREHAHAKEKKPKKVKQPRVFKHVKLFRKE